MKLWFHVVDVPNVPSFTLLIRLILTQIAFLFFVLYFKIDISFYIYFLLYWFQIVVIMIYFILYMSFRIFSYHQSEHLLSSVMYGNVWRMHIFKEEVTRQHWRPLPKHQRYSCIWIEMSSSVDCEVSCTHSAQDA